MMNQGIVQRKQAVRASLFKRHENLTVLSIFVGFVVIIVILQVIMMGGRGSPRSSAR